MGPELTEDERLAGVVERNGIKFRLIEDGGRIVRVVAGKRGKRAYTAKQPYLMHPTMDKQAVDKA